MALLQFAVLSLLIQFSICYPCSTTHFPNSNDALTATSDYAFITGKGEVDLATLTCETEGIRGAAFQQINFPTPDPTSPSVANVCSLLTASFSCREKTQQKPGPLFTQARIS